MKLQHAKLRINKLMIILNDVMIWFNYEGEEEAKRDSSEDL